MKDKISLMSVARLIFYGLMLLFMGLLYWSFVLQEDRLRSIDRAIQGLQRMQSEEGSEEGPGAKTPARDADNVQDREKFTNILVEDTYVTKTLPLLLGKEFVPTGVLRLASIGTPTNLHPFNGWAHITEWIGYCQGACATQKVGYYETLSPEFAVKIEERPTDRQDHASFWVHLRPDIFWQPLEQRHFPEEIALAPHFLRKHPVTAHDFKLFFDAVTNPHVGLPDAVALRFLLKDIERIDVIDPHTFRVIAKKSLHTDAQGKKSYVLPYATKFYVSQLKPLASFVYLYHPDGTKICEDDAGFDFYRFSSVWANHFVNHFSSHVIVSCGPWIFDSLSDLGIRFRRNPDYFNPYSALYTAMEVYFLETTDAIWRDLVAQKIDLCVTTPENLRELERYVKSEEYASTKAKGHELERLNYLMRSFSYVAWNQKNHLFQSKKVRLALTLAIDRNRLIRQNLQGQGVAITGPFFVSSPDNDPALLAYPYDPDEAKRLLAEEGWFDASGDGIVDKEIGGELVPFRFRLTYFVKNAISRANCEMIRASLRDVGIDCELNGVDLADLSSAVEEKSFDALYLAWALSAPPEDPRQLWHSEGADEKGSSNIICFRNKEVDHLIDTLAFVSDKAERQKLFHKLHKILYDEVPYTYLFTPKVTLLWWNSVHNIFIPKCRQDILPGADVGEPLTTYSWK